MVIRNPSRFFPNTWPKLHLLLTLSGTYCETRMTAQAKILTEPAVTEEQMVLL